MATSQWGEIPGDFEERIGTVDVEAYSIYLTILLLFNISPQCSYNQLVAIRTSQSNTNALSEKDIKNLEITCIIPYT